MGPDEYVEFSEKLIRVIEIVAAYILVGLFAIGVFDLGLSIAQLVRTGEITQTRAVVGLIDEMLLLFVIVEIYQTVVAYAQERSVVRIVIIAAIIAVTRKIITYHPGDFPTMEKALFAAVSFSLLLAMLTVAMYFLRETQEESEGEVF